MSMLDRLSLSLVAGLLLSTPCLAQLRQPQPANVITRGEGGKLGYVADEKGNRVPDFSYAGYRGGDTPIPQVPVRVVVSPVAGDNTQRIQRAIDYVAALPADQRGAVLLGKGRFEIAGALKLSASGVVLRGSGAGPEGSTLVATGLDRRTLITIAGANDRKVGSAVAVADSYVPVNAMSFRVASAGSFKVDDLVQVRRPSPAEWIVEMGMNDFGGDRHGPMWRPGSRDVIWDRSVTAVDADRITLDAPITAALDSKFGGGSVAGYSWPGRIIEVGVENLSCESTFDANNPKDENHSWFGITIENAADAWVRQVTFRHFAGSAVAVWDSAKRVTVEDCKSTKPVGEIGGWRRNTFFTSGQQVLMQRLYAEDGRHDFAVGFTAAGPNAFVQCESLRSTEESGAIDSWACGTLFDLVKIDGNALSLRDRMYRAQGSGWSGANSVLWNCAASVIECWKPPTAQNWAFGTWGEFSGDGYYFGSNDSVEPDSLYYAQLADRIGNAATKDRVHLLLIKTNASSSPGIDVAAELAEISKKPMPLLSDFIDQAAQRQPIAISSQGAKTIDELPTANAPDAIVTEPTLAVTNGWLVMDQRLLTGGRMGIPWWNGSMRPDGLERAAPAVTRFVPGRIGRGLTDDLEEVVQGMARSGRIALEQHPPLWYDRRRDDHERIRRMDGDVLPPFYEWPVARSGQGLAWDGLSKWDLTKPNPWYFERLRKFADLGAQSGLLLINMHYMQHSILEAGAHYADFPWRTANNINNTPFPEPPYYAGDKRVFIGEQFYDVSNPALAELHRKYIRIHLDQLAEASNVLHLTSEEYTGSLRFVQFWLDTIAQWQKETGRKVIVGLSATKDVQDAILADPPRAAVVSVIDIRYWWYQANGQAYAPKGGLNLAPRQHARITRNSGSSFEQTARAVREYRAKFPEKAVIYSASEGAGWAVLMGGGSLPAMREPLDPALLRAIPLMKPVDLPSPSPGQLALSDGKSYLIYCNGESRPSMDTTGFNTRQFNAGEGSAFWLTRRD